MTPSPAPQNAKAVLEKNVSEDDLLTAIVEAALFLGWRVHHDRRSDKALQQGSPGFPDLVLARRGRVLFIECKSETGQLTTEQWGWHSALDGPDWPNRHECFIWRPADLDAALEELVRP